MCAKKSCRCKRAYNAQNFESTSLANPHPKNKHKSLNSFEFYPPQTRKYFWAPTRVSSESAAWPRQIQSTRTTRRRCRRCQGRDRVEEAAAAAVTPQPYRQSQTSHRPITEETSPSRSFRTNPKLHSFSISLSPGLITLVKKKNKYIKYIKRFKKYKYINIDKTSR